jgi:hypothetical protein
MKKVDSYFERNLMKERLIDMYQLATLKEIHKESISDIQELVNYYAELKKYKAFYMSLLKTCGVDFNNEKTIEVGVGPIDSVLKDYYATIVTPYYGLFKRGQGKTYEGSYVVNNGDIDAKLANLIKVNPKCISLELPANTDDEKKVCQAGNYYRGTSEGPFGDQ